MRWVGIDEAGYGPNLGPLVLTAVIAEGPEDQAPDVWSDLAATVGTGRRRAGRLWVDDSKAILHAGKGRDRLEAALPGGRVRGRGGDPSLARRPAGRSRRGNACRGRIIPVARRWRPGAARPWGRLLDRAPAPRRSRGRRGGSRESDRSSSARRGSTLDWRGRARRRRSTSSRSPSLLAAARDRAADGVVTHVRSDKHGGRHFYLHPLREAFPDTWIDHGPEGPALSRYVSRAGPSPGVEPAPPRRRRGRPRRAGLDRQQDRSRALDGRLQCPLDRPDPGPPPNRRLPSRRRAVPPGDRARVSRLGPRPQPLVAHQITCRSADRRRATDPPQTHSGDFFTLSGSRIRDFKFEISNVCNPFGFYFA